MSVKIKIVDPEVELISIEDPTKKVEMAYRICYQSMDKMCHGSEALIKKCLYPESGTPHESPLEHVYVEVHAPAMVAEAIRLWQMANEYTYITMWPLGEIDEQRFQIFGNLRAFMTFWREVNRFDDPTPGFARSLETYAASRAVAEAFYHAFPQIFEEPHWDDLVTSELKLDHSTIRVTIDKFAPTFRIVTTRDVLQEPNNSL